MKEINLSSNPTSKSSQLAFNENTLDYGTYEFVLTAEVQIHSSNFLFGKNEVLTNKLACLVQVIPSESYFSNLLVIAIVNFNKQLERLYQNGSNNNQSNLILISETLSITQYFCLT